LAAHHTANEIAKIKHCTPKTVRQALRKNKLRAKRKSGELEQKAIELYTEQQLSPYQIAPMLNKPRATINHWIRKAGISRGRREAGKLAYKRSIAALHNRREEQQSNCPHQFQIRLEDGYACLRCKKYFPLSS
jgi:DNA-directed RNA polymerase specialized sigma24 family protein